MYRLIAKDTIEESILQCAQNKLRLERDMAASDDGESKSNYFLFFCPFLRLYVFLFA